jgi:hypothetical protein
VARKRVDGDKTLDISVVNVKVAVLWNVTPRCLVLDTVVSEESGVSFYVVDVTFTFKMIASTVEISARHCVTHWKVNLAWGEAYRHYLLSLR